MRNQEYKSQKEKSVSGGRPENAFINNHQNSRNGAKLNDLFYFTHNSNFSQCKNCRESCAKFKYQSQEGLCRSCEQKAEYIWREFPKYRQTANEVAR